MTVFKIRNMFNVELDQTPQKKNVSLDQRRRECLILTTVP